MEHSLESATHELEQMKIGRDHDKQNLLTLTSDLSLQQTKNQQLIKDIQLAQQEVYSLPIYVLVFKFYTLDLQVKGLKEAAADARTGYTDNAAMLRATFTAEKDNWRKDTDALKQEHSATK